MEKKFGFLAKLAKPALLIVFLASMGGNIYLMTEASKLKATPTAQASEEMAQLVEAVGKLMVLPQGEDPTVATVSDPTKLSAQDFFKNAQVGDKVLLYTTAKKAILYSPISGKIVEVAPINIGDSTATDTTTPDTTTPVMTEPTTTP
ncbi:MAG: hypothetical protein WCT24_03730 [Patescibacteria group bacterium]